MFERDIRLQSQALRREGGGETAGPRRAADIGVLGLLQSASLTPFSF